MANFAVGIPHEMAMPACVDAVRRHLEPRDKDWFAYNTLNTRLSVCLCVGLERPSGPRHWNHMRILLLWNGATGQQAPAKLE